MLLSNTVDQFSIASLLLSEREVSVTVKKKCDKYIVSKRQWNLLSALERHRNEEVIYLDIWNKF